jgi:hypothetical protein
MVYAYSTRLAYVPNSAFWSDIRKQLGAIAGKDLVVGAIGVYVKDISHAKGRERLATVASLYEIDRVSVCADYRHVDPKCAGNSSQAALLLLRTALSKELDGNPVYVLGRHPNALIDLPLCGFELQTSSQLNHPPAIIKPFVGKMPIYCYNPKQGQRAVQWLLNWLSTRKVVSLGSVIKVPAEFNIDLRIGSNAADLKRALSY